MPGSFEFMRESFPEIYADAQKAEEYLSTDNAACMLHNMRIFRSKNAHNEDTSSLDSRKLLDQARSLCGRLARNSGGTVPGQSAVKHVKDGGTVDIISLVNGYRRTPAEYEGKHLTVKGGRLVNRVWSSPNQARRQDKPRRKHGREDDYIRKTMAIIAIIAAAAAFLKFLFGG